MPFLALKRATVAGGAVALGGVAATTAHGAPPAERPRQHRFAAHQQLLIDENPTTTRDRGDSHG
jgi:hypothetical protein